MIVVVVLVVIVFILYLYNNRNFGYWKKRGIKYVEPIAMFGTNQKLYFGKQSRSQMAEEMYWMYPNEKAVGGFRSSVPELVLRDPELIKQVLITDFSHFYKRGINSHDKVFEPIRKHLFSVEGDLWRMLRQRLTPAFTSGKLKAMFPLIVERTDALQARTLTAARDCRPIDARNLMACFTTDIIGAVGFGIDSDSLNDEGSAFRKIGAEIFKPSTRELIIAMLKEVFPELFKHVKNFERIERNIFAIVEQIKKQRNNQPIGRNDFIDLLLEYQKKGPMQAESIEKTNEDGSPLIVSAELDDKLFSAQVFVFFAAGFETSSSSTSFTLHQLAYNPDVQKKVQQNIDDVLAKYDNKLSYEAVKEMTYLEWAFKEGLRMFPSLGYLIRKCTKKYTFKDINLTIDEGVIILIPVQGLHMDPKYWDNPEEFRPERFDPDNFTSVQKSVYFPFGDGPRNCIGSRLGLMQSIAGLAAILSKFTVEPAPESIKELNIEPRSHIVQGLRRPLPLLFRERKKID